MEPAGGGNAGRWHPWPIGRELSHAAAGHGGSGHSRAGCGAFTLVELLVVAAVLALLVAILLPALQGARESANQVVCLSNERQIGAILLDYALDNDGYLLRELGVQHGPDWTEAVRRALTRSGDAPFADIGVFQCPSFPLPDQSLLPRNLRVPEPAEQHLDYVTNGFGIDGDPERIENHLNRIQRPAELVYLTEGSKFLPMIEVPITIPGIGRVSLHDVWHVGHIPGSGVGRNRRWYLRLRVARDRHGHEVNVLFMDGHGEGVPTRDLADLSVWIDGYDAG